MVRSIFQPMVLLLCTSLQAQGSFEARIAAVEKTLERFYRGECLEVSLERSTQGIESFNAFARKRRAEMEQDRVQLEQSMVKGREERASLDALDRELKNLSPGLDQDVIRQKVEARNALVKRVNELTAQDHHRVEDYNAGAKRAQEAIERERAIAVASQEAVNKRLDAFEAFKKAGQDLAFFTGLNRLLAEIREAQRKTPADPALQTALVKVRTFRRELAAWAVAGQALRPNGLLIVEARVEDEPCWFVVDTGAMDTILSPELVDAIGQGGNMGKEASLSVVGGLRVLGRSLRIPRLEVNGQVLKGVQASAVVPSDVGIDGLLGQSFLKGFVYTIDERKAQKLSLTQR